MSSTETHNTLAVRYCPISQIERLKLRVREIDLPEVKQLESSRAKIRNQS